jgi:septum formation protein
LKKIILASGSPRRKSLLQQLGLDFVSSPANISEDLSISISALEIVQTIALQKALEVSRRFDSGILIAADTVVVREGNVLGKPVNRDEAYGMLVDLSNQRHQVITGLCVMDVEHGVPDLAAETTTVFFRSLASREIDAYLDYGEWEDKAGAYAIQGLGALLVDHIDGCYFNVVGLPLNRLHLMLRKQGVDLLGEN